MKSMVEFLFKAIEEPMIWLLNARSRPLTAPNPVGKSDAIGESVETGDPLTLNSQDLARHAYILGSTGTGKTSMILQLIQNDLAAEHSLVVLDMRGDLVDGALSLCSDMGVCPSRVHLLDLREKVRIQGFNPLLGAGEPFIRALHVLDVLASEAESWGVQLEETLRCALLLLASSGEPLTKIASLFYSESFRAKCLDGVSDDELVGFWERYDAMTPEKQQAWALPVLNKVTGLLAVPSLRAVLSGEPSLDLGKLLDEKGSVLLVSLAVDEFHRSSRMLGALITSAISREILARVSQSHRNPVRVYVDEFENMASEAFESLIAEGRRFGLSLVLSHQTLAQIQPKLRSVVRNNVGLQILFQCGFQDAVQLQRELPEGFKLEDIRELKIGQAIMMRRDGSAETVQFRKPPRLKDSDAYRLKVLPPAPLPPNPKAVVKGPITQPENWL